MLNFYFHASSRQKGALGILNVYGEQGILAERIDGHVRTGNASRGELAPGELRHGWLYAAGGEKLDEIMVAAPQAGMRVLMTHGGEAVRAAMDNYLRSAGFREADADAKWFEDNGDADGLWDFFLSRTVTEAQAAALLKARSNISNPGEITCFAQKILTTHRVILAGPPNAGKSSLLNHLAGYDRAFVHSEAGATRDVVDELVDLGGFAVVLGDMPGFCSITDELGRMAWEKAFARLRQAEAVFFVVDGSVPWDERADAAARAVREGLNAAAPLLVVINKADLPCALRDAPWTGHFPRARSVCVCSLPQGNARMVLDRAANAMLSTAYPYTDSK